MGRKESEELFLRSLEKLLAEGKEIGVNVIADGAGLNKVLLYRYFGGLDGLLEKYARKINLWRTIREELSEGFNQKRWKDSRETFHWIFKTYREKLLSSPVYLRILKDELSRPGPLTRKLETEREVEGLEIFKLLADYFPELSESDMAVKGSFIMGGLTYLVLKSTQVEIFSGLDLSDEKTWELIDKFWQSLTDSISK